MHIVVICFQWLDYEWMNDTTKYIMKDSEFALYSTYYCAGVIVYYAIYLILYFS